MRARGQNCCVLAPCDSLCVALCDILLGAKRPAGPCPGDYSAASWYQEDGTFPLRTASVCSSPQGSIVRPIKSIKMRRKQTAFKPRAALFLIVADF